MLKARETESSRGRASGTPRLWNSASASASGCPLLRNARRCQSSSTLSLNHLPLALLTVDTFRRLSTFILAFVWVEQRQTRTPFTLSTWVRSTSFLVHDFELKLAPSQRKSTIASVSTLYSPLLLTACRTRPSLRLLPSKLFQPA